jgi:outer membrane lipoprotein SlyB
MKKMILAAAALAAVAPAAPAVSQTSSQLQYEREMRQYEQQVAQYERQQRRYNRQTNRNWGRYRSYDYNRYEPGQSRYYADRYYRSGNYQARRLSTDDRIYRGRNGQYYCRRPDGTTGLIIGGIAGALLGSAIAPGNSTTIGALIGGAGGAVAGRAIDRNNVRCR